ncbi:uncharacterized protein C8R40DRAFT_414280 [Lentinula edodes]|uniref:uncharacterized protein n=1 Tax=Lentinula edodes TaxID=5353 RepID=UPI001E8E49AC|nr:uncharacterized protein C8R40DRAFT_414280 [Lentinula edodes]KAH7873037.1 hypothetical protein C8R40DRAFT_414280 [Lentinula edodes]
MTDQTGLSLPKSYFLSVFCEGIFHGMYTTLFCSAMYLLLHRRKSKRITNTIMTILTVVMYCISTVHLALSVRMNLVALFTQKAADGGETLYDDQGSPLYFGQVAFEVINCVLGDSIVTWRTWVLWGRDWRAIYFPCFLMVGSSVTGSVMVYQFSLSPPGQPNFSNNTTIWFSIFGGFSFLTNFYAVIVISLKTWLHQRKMKRVCVDVLVNGPRYYGALFLVIESGGIYCIAVILVIIFFVQSSNVVIILADMLAHLTGIYPTVIIVLVCLKLTQHDEMTRKEATLASMQFRGHPLATTTIQNEAMNPSRTYPLRPMKFNGLGSHIEDSPAGGSSDDIDDSEGNLGLSRKESDIKFKQHDVVIDFDEE